MSDHRPVRHDAVLGNDDDAVADVIHRVVHIFRLAVGADDNVVSNARVFVDDGFFDARIGANAKAIITGDLTQVDLPRNQRSGLAKASRILRNIDGIGYIELDEEDVVRHKLVKAILKAYDKEGQREAEIEETEKKERRERRWDRNES